MVANSPTGSCGTDIADEIRFLKFCSEVSTSAYEGTLRPGNAIEKLGMEGKKGQTIHHDYDIPGCGGYKMLRCMHAHHDCVKQYRKFYADFLKCDTMADEAKQFVADTLKKHEKQVVQALLKKHAKELMDRHRLWKNALDDLNQQASKVAPIKKRLVSIIQPLPVEALCDFEEDEIYGFVKALKAEDEKSSYMVSGSTPKISIDAGEKFIVLDNSNRLLWRVRKRNGEEGEVPALFLALPPPDATLTKKVARMEEEFANSVVKTTNFLKKSDKNNSLETMQILRLTNNQLDELQNHKINGTMFIHPIREMEEMLSDLTTIPKTTNHSSIKSMYSISTLSLASSSSMGRKSKKIFEIKTRLVDNQVEEQIECYAPEISEYEGHEVKMFIISAVTDPRDFKDISIDKATKAGIVDMTAGTYINPDTNDTMTIQEAMAEGLIKVERSVTRKQQEKEYKKRARSYETLLN
ncbi:uncharacterized protein LOC135494907 isoform X2 [Lineus longissimus]|uniref:uncharacterized protein LOC135494907 isoform X2 n=1 Tax=Lineus longissimus TaxID=88925 RepID=UPI002B4F4B95